MKPFTAAELRARIQKQAFGRFPEDKRDELRDEQAEQDASEESRDKETDCHADAIEALDQLEAAQDFNQ